MRAVPLVLLLPVFLCATPIVSIPVTEHPHQTFADGPCLFYGPGACPGQPDWLPYSGPTNGDGFDLTQAYTAGAIRSAVGDNFFLALDVNETSEAQTALLLEVAGVNGGPFSLANAPIAAQKNGTAWADYIMGAGGADLADLRPFSIAGLGDETAISFRFEVDGRGGPDKLFLVTAPAAENAPEPAGYGLIGIGLVALGMFARSRLRRPGN